MTAVVAGLYILVRGLNHAFTPDDDYGPKCEDNLSGGMMSFFASCLDSNIRARRYGLPLRVVCITTP